MLGRESYRISLYADMVPTVPEHESLRIYRSAPFLRDDGQLIRLWIYSRFVRTMWWNCRTSRRPTKT